jgi:hypothetical protein
MQQSGFTVLGKNKQKVLHINVVTSTSLNLILAHNEKDTEILLKVTQVVIISKEDAKVCYV